MGLIVKRRVTLDLSRRGHQVTVPFSVGDRVAHEVIFTLRDGSELIELPPGVTAAIAIKNGYNGTGCVDACVIDHVNNTITYTPTVEALSIEGNIECSLEVFDADKARIGSPTFIFAVSEGDNANTEREVSDALVASPGWGIIANTVKQAEDAATSAGNAATSEGNAAKSEGNAAKSAEAAAISAGAAAKSAGEAAEKAAAQVLEKTNENAGRAEDAADRAKETEGYCDEVLFGVSEMRDEISESLQEAQDYAGSAHNSYLWAQQEADRATEYGTSLLVQEIGNDDRKVMSQDASTKAFVGRSEVMSYINQEIAKIVANSPTDFDTLKEIAEYIASDKTNAAEINSKLSKHEKEILDNKTAIENLPELVQETGDREDAVMSQKAVTEIAEEKASTSYVDCPKVKQKDITSNFTFSNGYIHMGTGIFEAYDAARITDVYIPVNNIDGWVITAQEKYNSSILPVFDKDYAFLGSFFSDGRAFATTIAKTDEVLSAQAIKARFPTAKYVKIGNLASGGILPRIVGFENRENIFSKLLDDNQVLLGSLNLVPVIEVLPHTGEHSNGAYISAAGELGFLANADSSYEVKEYHLTTETVVYISAFANYNNKLYSFLDGSGSVLLTSTENTAGGTGASITDKQVNVPAGATKLYVANITSRNANYYGAKIQNGQRATKKWYGKKWVCVGDSLTEVNNRTTKHYHDYIAEQTDISVVNMGQSGTGYKKQDNENRAFYQRIVNVPADADVVTIFGSGNDMSAGVELGNVTDTGTATLCGCINTTIDNLYGLMPTVQLGIITPTPWQGSQPNTGSAMEAYANAIVEICKNRGIPCLDLYHCSNLRPWDATFRALAYSKDDGNGTHPDEKGHEIIAPRIEAFLDSLVLG